MDKDKLNFYIEKFDAYLDGNLSNEALNELEKVIDLSDDLKKELKLHIDSRASIRIAGEKDLKKTLNKRFTSKPNAAINLSSEESKKASKWPFVLLGLFLLSLAWFYLQDSPSKQIDEDPIPMVSLDQLEDPSFDVLRSDGETMEIDQWEATVKAFAKKEYQNALDLSTEIDLSNDFVRTNGGKFNLLIGVAHLKLRNHSKAKEFLQKVGLSNPYYDQALWYKAMNHLKSEERDAAKAAFKEIMNTPNHYKATAAKAYLKNIE